MIAGALKAKCHANHRESRPIHEYGPPEVLRFEDIVGEPGDDEALIRNTVIGLNFVDVYYPRGSLPVAFPAIIGDEAAGVVEAIGKNVKNVSVGDRVVYGDIAFGAYATARLHPADRLVRIPAGVSDDQAASTRPAQRQWPSSTSTMTRKPPTSRSIASV